MALALWLPELDRYATIDESRWVGRSADYVSYIQQGDLEETFIIGHPGVTTMWLGSLGLGAERVRAFSFLEGQTDVTRRDGYLDALVAARRAAVLANALALGGVVWLASGLFGWGAALVGGLLLLLDPFIGAHARLIHLDALLTSFMTLAALSAITYWTLGSRPYLIAAGIFTGLALLTKVPAIYLLAFIPLLALVEQTRKRWLLGPRAPALERSEGSRLPGWGPLLTSLGIWVGVAVLTCLALWPALRLRPLGVPGQMLDFAARNSGGERENFFLGQPVEDPGMLFYPLALLFRATPHMLLGLLLLGYMLVRRRQHLSGFWPALWLGVYALGFLLMMSAGQKKFDRYELPIFPALDLLAGLGLWLSLRSISWRPARLAPAVIGLAVLAAWPLASVYPYYLSYYNPLLGGGAAAQRVLFVGWGEGMDRVAAYLNEKPILLQAPSVATAYHRVLQAHLRGNNAMPLERAELADYIVPYVNSMQRDQKAEVLAEYLSGVEPEHVVWLHGIEYARIYRGPHLPVESTIAASFANRATLDSVVFAPGSGQARAGDDLLIRLRWRSVIDPASLVCTLRLVGSDGRAVLEEPVPLARGFREGELFILDAQLRLRNNIRPGEYQLEASLAQSGDGQLGAAAAIYRLSLRPAVAR